MLPSPRAWLEFEVVGVESVSDGFFCILLLEPHVCGPAEPGTERGKGS